MIRSYKDANDAGYPELDQMGMTMTACDASQLRKSCTEKAGLSTGG